MKIQDHTKLQTRQRTRRETHTLFIFLALACGFLQSQVIQGVITVILIIYKEESEIPRHARCEERGEKNNQVDLFQSNFPLQSQLSP